MVRFSEQFIDNLLVSVDLADLMRKKGVQVKEGAGKNAYYVASWCCGKTDFDNGRIDKNKQTFKCMACGHGGNAIHFLREYSGLTFHAAVKELCSISGIPFPEQDPAADEKEKRKQEALRLAVEFYQAQEHHYLLTRGISADVLKHAKAGYAPGGRALRNHLEQKGFTKEELQEFQLINHRGLDTLFYRAVIPHYMFGKIVDIYGRSVNTEKAKVPHMYLYGQPVLAGIDRINHNRIVNLFESAIDRLVAESHGIDNGVDQGGAAKFSAFHASILKRKKVKEVAIWYDGDQAGKDAAVKTGELLDKEGINVRIVELPEGEDPASMLQRGIEAVVPLTRAAKSYEQYRLKRILDQYPVEEIRKYLEEREANDP